jgi:hypothetical protein
MSTSARTNGQDSQLWFALNSVGHFSAFIFEHLRFGHVFGIRFQANLHNRFVARLAPSVVRKTSSNLPPLVITSEGAQPNNDSALHKSSYDGTFLQNIRMFRMDMYRL